MIMKIRKSLLLSILCILLSPLTCLNANAGMVTGVRDLDIVFIVNSITYGARLEKPQFEAPPVVASNYLRHQPKIRNVDFVNQGRSGYTTVDYLPSSGNTFAEVITATRLLHKNAQRLLVFSISLGTNDSAMEGPNGSPVDPSDYFKNLKMISNKLLTIFPDCKIIFQQPIWYSPNTYNGAKYLAEGLTRLQRYFPELEALVESYSHTNQGHVLMGDKKGFSYFENNCLTDLDPESGKQGTFYLHPNKKGAEMLGTFWGEAIYRQIIQ